MPQSVILKLAELGARKCLADMQVAFTQLSGSTVTIDCSGVKRLPSELLGPALRDARAQHGVVCLEALSDFSRLAICVIDQEGVLQPERAAHELLCTHPFVVHVEGKGLVMIRVLKGILQHPDLGETTAHDWLRGLEAPGVTVDLSQIEHVNSQLVAWLLQLSQAAAPAEFKLVNLTRQVATQLKQLRLDDLMQIA